VYLLACESIHFHHSQYLTLNKDLSSVSSWAGTSQHGFAGCDQILYAHRCRGSFWWATDLLQAPPALLELTDLQKHWQQKETKNLGWTRSKTPSIGTFFSGLCLRLGHLGVWSLLRCCGPPTNRYGKGRKHAFWILLNPFESFWHFLTAQYSLGELWICAAQVYSPDHGRTGESFLDFLCGGCSEPIPQRSMLAHAGSLQTACEAMEASCPFGSWWLAWYSPVLLDV